MTKVIYQHPLAYLIGLEGIALWRAFSGEYDHDFTTDRFAEVRALLDSAARADRRHRPAVGEAHAGRQLRLHASLEPVPARRELTARRPLYSQSPGGKICDSRHVL